MKRALPLLLGLLLATLLVIANRRLFVYEDPRIDDVESLLPHANCGACGTAGCRAFAEQLVAGQAQPGQCTVNSKDMNQLIADYLGVDPGTQEQRVARLACAGGNHVAHVRASYSGLDTCRAAALIERFERDRLPRLLDIHKRVLLGEILSDGDIAFLETVIGDAQQNKPLIDRHPDWHNLCANVFFLYEEITTRALQNESD